ncbi:MAG: M48 family metallopeptidase [Paracoccaceae bacterium]
MIASLTRALALCLAASLSLQGCVLPEAAPATAMPGSPRDRGRIAAQTFVTVADRVEPVAEAICRRRMGPANCDITIAVDDNPALPPNAYQMLDDRGRPFVVFTLSLIANAQNADELAFVMGHEAGHHIASHIPRRKEQAQAGELLAGILAQTSGLGAKEVRAAQAYGADLGARQYSKEYELEADVIGTEIALAAGYDPLRGAAFFDRLPDPGQSFLSTHPGNAQRKAVVAQTVRRLTGG